MILVSEIGDKTFFIAAIMAMKNPRSTVGFLVEASHTLSPKFSNSTEQTFFSALRAPEQVMYLQVFAGAFAALAAMTVLSAGMGWAAPNLVRYQQWL